MTQMGYPLKSLANTSTEVEASLENGPVITRLQWNNSSWAKGLEFEEIDKYSRTPIVKKYALAIKGVLVNGVAYLKDRNESQENHVFEVSASGLRIKPGTFVEGENVVLVKADGFHDKEIRFTKNSDVYAFVSQTDVSNTVSIDVDKTELQKVIAVAKRIEKGIASETAFQALQQAIHTAETVYATSTSTQDVLVQARKELQKAMDVFNPSNIVEDGVYTLSFKANKEGKTESSMLEGAFDPNVKLTIKDGNMTISMLNTALVNFLLDFSIESEGTFPKSVMRPMGEQSNDGTYKLKEFTMPITNLSVLHKGGVLVTAMGGQVTDIGNYNTYTKLDMTFFDMKKGWNDYQHNINEKNALKGAAQIEKLLVTLGYDSNNDGSISSDELAAITGNLDLSGERLTDISYLKGLSSKVTTLNLNGNQIETLPNGLLDNLTNLENLYVSANKIESIPKDFFKNNQKLKVFYISTNKLSALHTNDFKGLVDIQELSFGNNRIERVEPGAFDGFTHLTSLSFTQNKLTEFPLHLLRPLTSLRMIFLEGNGFTKIPEDLAFATKLEKLYIGKNKVTQLQKKTFKNLDKLRMVDVRSNRIGKVEHGVFSNNIALEEVNLFDNDLTAFSKRELPETADVANMSLNLRMNNMVEADVSLRDELKENKFSPQKTELKLQLRVEGNTLKWTQELDVLDLLYWYDSSIAMSQKELKNLDEYRAMLREKGFETKKIVDILDDNGYDWDIQTELQKKDENGRFMSVSSVTSSDVKDQLGGEFEGLSDGTYRLVKTVYGTRTGRKGYEFSVVSKEVAIHVAPNPSDFGQVIEGNGIKVVGNIGAAVKIEVSQITKGKEVDAIRTQLQNASSEQWFYNISLKDVLNNSVQPNGKVHVTILLPKVNLKNFKMYHYTNDMVEEVKIVNIDNGNVTFETSTFSVFALVSIQDPNAGVEDTRDASAPGNGQMQVPTSISNTKSASLRKVGNVQTNDTTRVGLYIMGMLITMAVLVIIKVKKKKV